MIKILLSKFSKVTLSAFLLSLSFFTAEAACDNPAFLEGKDRNYAVGDIISRNGVDYKVTVAGWVNVTGSDWAYAPGTGVYWNLAWTVEKNPCVSTGVVVGTCSDGIKNQDETGIDCGGSKCSPCSTTGTGTCSDGIKNQDETGIDCGGSKCSPCSTGGGATCSDGIKNQDETGIDCGGSKCSPCSTGGGGGTGSSCSSTTYTAGYATFYNLLEDGSSSVVKCSFDALTDVKGTKYGALHKTMLNETPAKYCGMCVEMTGTAGTATLQIVDECPTCTHSSQDIDLSPQAFAAVVGAQSIGIQNISWKEVSCPWTTPIKLIIQGSNDWYAKVIVANHVNRIDKVEIKVGGTYVAMTRLVDNGWEKGTLGGGASFDFKITDIYGGVIEIKGVDLRVGNGKVVGTSNFPACGFITSTNEINSLDYVSLYPNPATSSVTFEGLEDVQTIQIINLNGSIVATQFLGGTISIASLDVSNLAPGMYVARLIGNSKAGTVTFVKQ